MDQFAKPALKMFNVGHTPLFYFEHRFDSDDFSLNINGNEEGSVAENMRGAPLKASVNCGRVSRRPLPAGPHFSPSDFALRD